MLRNKDWRRGKKQKMSKEKLRKLQKAGELLIRTLWRLQEVMKKWGLDQDSGSGLINNWLDPHQRYEEPSGRMWAGLMTLCLFSGSRSQNLGQLMWIRWRVGSSYSALNSNASAKSLSSRFSSGTEHLLQVSDLNTQHLISHQKEFSSTHVVCSGFRQCPNSQI